MGTKTTNGSWKIDFSGRGPGIASPTLNPILNPNLNPILNPNLNPILILNPNLNPIRPIGDLQYLYRCMPYSFGELQEDELLLVYDCRIRELYRLHCPQGSLQR